MNGIFISPLFVVTALVIAAGLAGIIMLTYFMANFRKGKYHHWMYRTLMVIQRFEVFAIAVFVIVISAYCFSLIRTLPVFTRISKYETLIILLITGISVLTMNYLSGRFGHRGENQAFASIRLLGHIYAVINMLLIRFITGDSVYDSVVICYLGMVLGRFIYFDTALDKVLLDLQGLKKNLPVALVMLVYVTTMLFLYQASGIPILGEDMILQMVVLYTAVLFGLKITNGILKGMHLL